MHGHILLGGREFTTPRQLRQPSTVRSGRSRISGSLCKGQQGAPFLSTVRSNLMCEEVDKKGRDERVHENYLLDHKDLARYTPLGKVPALAVHQPFVPHLMSLIHALHTHPGDSSTLALIRERSYWPFMARDVREYVISCGYGSRRRSAPQKVVVLLGRAIQPWDVLEMDFMSLDIKSITGNEYLVLVVDKPCKFWSHSPFSRNTRAVSLPTFYTSA